MPTPQTSDVPKQEASSWEPLGYSTVIHAPDTYGVVVVANSRREPILVTHGVIRDELWRIVNDPLARSHDAAFFRFIVTLVDEKARALAEKMFQEASEGGGTGLRWRYFPSPEPPADVPRTSTKKP